MNTYQKSNCFGWIRFPFIHSGWKIIGDQAVVRNFDENTKYFEIYLEKEGESKTVYYNSMGGTSQTQIFLIFFRLVEERINLRQSVKTGCHMV